MDSGLITIEPTPRRRLPPWIRQRVPGGERYAYLKNVLREFKLHTVCEEAKCPNMGECWEHGAATFMLMGDVCTRRCNFCAVDKGKPGFLDAAEPEHVAEVVAAMKLDYCVLTSVTRQVALRIAIDIKFARHAASVSRSLPDGGADSFAVPCHVARQTDIY